MALISIKWSIELICCYFATLSSLAKRVCFFFVIRFDKVLRLIMWSLTKRFSQPVWVIPGVYFYKVFIKEVELLLFLSLNDNDELYELDFEDCLAFLFVP